MIGWCEGMEWISVEDRLPDRYGYYLTFKQIIDDEWYAIVLFNEKGFVEVVCAAGDLYKDKVSLLAKCDCITHWMPLPEPPNNR